MGSPVVQVFLHKLQPGVSSADYEEALVRCHQVVKQLDGFLQRQAFVDEESGYWLDVSYWENLNAITNVPDAIAAAPVCQGHSTMYNEDGMLMLFFREVDLHQPSSLPQRR